jgi:hypothetical protein
MATIAVLAGLALCAGCVVDTDESGDDIDDVESVENPLGVGADQDGDDVDGDLDPDEESEGSLPQVDPDPSVAAVPSVVDEEDTLGHEEEPDPVPWSPGKSGQDGSSSNNDT